MAAVPNNYTQPRVKNQEMPEAMVKDILDVSVKAFQEFRTEREISNTIKKFLDTNHTPTWNCIVGKDFGSYITHETKRYLNFTIGHQNILVWKCG